MNDLNTKMKLKVLEDLKAAMDHRLTGRLKPKKAVEIESIKVEPLHKEELGVKPELGPKGLEHGELGEKPGLPDEDSQRLMDLYSKLK